eukprot:TRINITY_DN8805_c0_g8_i1.p1 TRINITY_DN8805_c0_g8~~TRINITY_DN8805_c0_g8_i1.p1  ORF type:complete len:643 (+),score=96.03 TRINITY_DN8805_c0_g8_i1:173-2101(+)
MPLVGDAVVRAGQEGELGADGVASSYGRTASEKSHNMSSTSTLRRGNSMASVVTAISASASQAAEGIKQSTRMTFIRRSASAEGLDRKPLRTIAGCRNFARRLVRDPYFEFLSGLVVFLDFLAICRDADAKARRDSDLLAVITMNAAMGLYIFDLALRVFVHGRSVVKHKAHMLDFFIICVSVFEKCLELLHDVTEGSSLLMIRMVRLCRLLRLVRVVKLFSGMKELRRLTQMIATCARTLFWSFLLSFLVMSMWAVAAVELANPVAQKLATQGAWDNCERCGRAFNSVLAANLTFFQTIFAGDSWGELMIPIIEDSPLTAFVFCGALMTLMFGIMQLITAVVVDTFADLRKMDVNTMAAEMEAEEKEEKRFLFEMLGAIDVDCNDEVTWDELADGALRVKDFQDWLRVMDIDQADLERLFQIIDSGRTGQISITEFVDVLYRLRNAEQKTTSKLVKHILDNLEVTAGELVAKVSSVQNRLEEMERKQSQSHITTKPGSRQNSCTLSHKRSDTSLREAGLPDHRACLLALEACQAAVMESIQLMGNYYDRTKGESCSLEAGKRNHLKKRNHIDASETSSHSVHTRPIHPQGDAHLQLQSSPCDEWPACLCLDDSADDPRGNAGASPWNSSIFSAEAGQSGLA